MAGVRLREGGRQREKKHRGRWCRLRVIKRRALCARFRASYAKKVTGDNGKFNLSAVRAVFSLSCFVCYYAAIFHPGMPFQSWRLKDDVSSRSAFLSRYTRDLLRSFTSLGDPYTMLVGFVLG